MLSQLLSKVTVTSCSFKSNVQCVRTAAGRRIQAGDATDQWRDQPNADISQGSVATHLRCGGIFRASVVSINFLLILHDSERILKIRYYLIN